MIIDKLLAMNIIRKSGANTRIWNHQHFATSYWCSTQNQIDVWVHHILFIAKYIHITILLPAMSAKSDTAFGFLFPSIESRPRCWICWGNSPSKTSESKGIPFNPNRALSKSVYGHLRLLRSIAALRKSLKQRSTTASGPRFSAPANLN